MVEFLSLSDETVADNYQGRKKLARLVKRQDDQDDEEVAPVQLPTGDTIVRYRVSAQDQGVMTEIGDLSKRTLKLPRCICVNMGYAHPLQTSTEWQGDKTIARMKNLLVLLNQTRPQVLVMLESVWSEVSQIVEYVWPYLDPAIQKDLVGFEEDEIHRGFTLRYSSKTKCSILLFHYKKHGATKGLRVSLSQQEDGTQRTADLLAHTDVKTGYHWHGWKNYLRLVDDHNTVSMIVPILTLHAPCAGSLTRYPYSLAQDKVRASQRAYVTPMISTAHRMKSESVIVSGDHNMDVTKMRRIIRYKMPESRSTVSQSHPFTSWDAAPYEPDVMFTAARDGDPQKGACLTMIAGHSKGIKWRSGHRCDDHTALCHDFVVRRQIRPADCPENEHDWYSDPEEPSGGDGSDKHDRRVRQRVSTSSMGSMSSIGGLDMSCQSQAYTCDDSAVDDADEGPLAGLNSGVSNASNGGAAASPQVSTGMPPLLPPPCTPCPTKENMIAANLQNQEDVQGSAEKSTGEKKSDGTDKPSEEKSDNGTS